MPAGPPRPDVFDEYAEKYDGWYDARPGSAIFASELDALGPLLEGTEHPWLEVGVGSGRFAAALGVEHGIDPAPRALVLASQRGIATVVGRAEGLPYPAKRFGAVLFVAALCFVDDPARALSEARRVLRRGGALVLGILPAEGPWARHYQELASLGDPYFSRAHFFSRDEIQELLRTAGFRIERTRSALFWPPDAKGSVEPAHEGDDPAAGFLAIRAVLVSNP